MIIEAGRDKPWIILIHGLGVTENVWFAPLQEKTNFISFKTLLKEEKQVVPLAEKLTGEYNIASWSQGSYDTVEEAAGELKALADTIDGRHLFCVAHSRGGLVARLAIQRFGLAPEALICLATPHYGSRFADLIMRYSWAVRIFFPRVKAYRYIISELSTDSDLIRDLNDPQNLELERHIPHYDIGGSSTHYLSVKLHIFGKSLTIFKLMASLEGFFGSRMIPEWQNGSGDGFVSLASSKSPITSEGNFFTLPVNHANILIDNQVSNIVSDILGQYL